MNPFQEEPASVESPESRSCFGDRRGVALPLALFGLVAVSVLVTAALLTSTVELAVSRAHQAAGRSLYEADHAVEEFVARAAAMSTDLHLRLVPGSYSAPGGSAFIIDVSELYRSGIIVIAGGGTERREVYSLVARPSSGRGRSVGAMIEALRSDGGFGLTLDSGLTLGTNRSIHIGAGARISDGSTAGVSCESAAAGVAMRYGSDASFELQGSAEGITGTIVQDSLEGRALISQVLGGRDPSELSALAQIRFGSFHDRPAFDSSVPPNRMAANSDYRWGCPTRLMAGCSTEEAAFYPAVAIDAAGGRVVIAGDHGQGILIIQNGDLHIGGEFLYQGIILVEGSLVVTGNPRLEGAVVAMGEVVIDPGSPSGYVSGESLVRFDPCEVAHAQRASARQSLDMAPQTLNTATFAWFEVVR